MRLINTILIIFLILTNGIKADSKTQVLEYLKKGNNLIFIRHAYAPGSGDPDNFDIYDCSTQRNLSKSGREQSKKIGNFFEKNKIPIAKIITSEWCRCKETALIAFGKFETKNFLNSFFSVKFLKKKKTQIKDLKKFINNWNSDKNLILVTHYVVIKEVLGYASSSGEIVISDKNFKKIGSIEMEY
jgi:phosphohistidine phosphatase SixA